MEHSRGKDAVRLNWTVIHYKRTAVYYQSERRSTIVKRPFFRRLP